MIGLLIALSCTSRDKDSGIVELREVVTDRGSYQISYVPTPDPIPLDAEFNLEIMVHDASTGSTISEEVTVEATAEMPTHGHGMVQEPVTTLTETGSFLSEGFLFHMSGPWELYVYVSESLDDGSTNIEQGIFEVECCY